MAVTIPAGDIVNAAIQAEITALTSAITANPLVANALQQQQLALQAQLVMNLIAAASPDGSGSGNNTPGVFASHLTPASILSNCTVNT